MGVMTKLRESTSVVLWIVVFAFGGLWVLQDSGAFETVGMRQAQNIAVVDGVPISYNAYNEAFEQRLRAYRQETGEEPSPELRNQIAEQVYQELVDDKLREREMDRLGVTVSDSEVREMILGPNPDPIIQQLFPDADGGVDRARVVALFNDPGQFADIYGIDPIVLEDYLRAKRRAEKLDVLLTSSVRVTEGEIREEYVRRNSRASAEYVALRYAAIPDEQVEVTDSDLRRFYNENREEFFRPRMVTLEYVAISQAPSAADSQAVMGQLEGLRSEFAATDNDSIFVAQRFSDQPFTGEFMTPGELEPELGEAVFQNVQPGRVVGPLVAGGQAMIAKIVDARPAAQPAVRARHILIGQRGDDETIRAGHLADAERLLERLRAGEISFDEAARSYSQDPGSAARGGDLGYFSRGRMVEPFEQAAFGASTGEVVGPVETQFGYHIIEVTGRADQDVQLAIVAQDVTLTTATISRLQDQMQDVKYYSEQRGGSLQAEAERRDLEVQTVTVEADQPAIPGIGTNRQVRDWVEGARRGRTSDIIDTGDQFVYLRAAEVQSEGYRPFDEVRAELEPRVRLEKKRDMQVARMREALSQHGFSGLAVAVDSQQRTAESVRYDNTMITGLGREPRFVGTALGLREGQTSGVVAGDNAVFVLRVTQSTIPDPSNMSAAERDNIRSSLTNRKIRQVAQEWMEHLREGAEIQDYRAQFPMFS
jgi:peptidyl-prolyl cis-trans isomerase D